MRRMMPSLVKAVAATACLMGTLGAAQQPTPPVTVADFTRRVVETTKLGWNDYVNARYRLEQDARVHPEWLAAARHSTNDWHVALLCSIISHRIAKAEEFQQFLNIKRNARPSEKERVRIETQAQAIAQDGKEIPVMLIECLWKMNEIDEIEWSRGGMERKGYVAHALGLLRVKEARPVLE